jgi:hypothetical protein
VRFTLVSDGPSDQALIPILMWSLRRHGAEWAIEPQWADPRRIADPPRQLAPRIRLSLKLYPCELLFIHRDAEAQPLTRRLEEILHAIDELGGEGAIPPFVCVVPIRMMEAWLLLDEVAIRAAAGNPNGRDELNMPPIRELEDIPDPKDVLHRVLINASGLGARRRRSLNPRRLVYRVAELIEDFSVLDDIPAFARFDTELGRVLRNTGLITVP